MSKWEHLPKAPITEALIDIRVQLPQGTDIQSLSPFRDEIRGDYPTCRERRKGHAELVFGEKGPPKLRAETQSPDGYVLKSADGRQVVQARLDGFTFSRLKPYQDWNHLRGTARELWAHYLRATHPVSVTRIAVRYINRLELPVPFEDFREWVLTLPEIAPGLPRRVAGFFLRLNIPFEEPRGFVYVIQTIDPGKFDTHVPLIFDIDAFLPEPFEPGSDTFWERLDQLHEIKNRVFFGSITDKTKDLFR